MKSRTFPLILVAWLGAAVLVALAWRDPLPVLAFPPAFPDNCGLNPSNLFRNGSMAPGHDTAMGQVSNEWEPFAITGSPRFEWVDNEKWDANGAQYFWSDSVPFDAGIYQTVGNLHPGMYYRFRIGYSHARLDPGNAKNEVHPSMGRQVGVDPFGGTDPKSPNLIWGPALFNSSAGMNLQELTMTFAARADKATMYFRGIFTGAGGRAKVWFDVACMEPLPDMATATPAQPTATPVPPTNTPRPATNTPRPAVVRAPNTPTKPAPTSPANTPTLAVAMAIKDTPAPEETSDEDAPAPRYARPDAAPVTSLPVDPGAGIAVVTGLLFVFGAFAFFAIGIVWWIKMSRGT